MKKEDIIFLILVRLDSIERLENLLSVTDYISSYCFPVVVWESATFCNNILKKNLNKNIRYEFFQDYDPILFRTKYLNQMVQAVKSPFIAIWDCDVIVPSEQIFKAMKLLSDFSSDFVIPYEKHCFDTSPILRKLFLGRMNIDILEQNKNKMKEIYSPNPLGGAFMANREAYIEAGMENEDFYGWGLEDGERFFRWKSKQYKIERILGPLYHLSHGRGLNSMYHNPDQRFLKQKEVLKTMRLVENEQFKLNID
jgi:predicted glycosyltransferase involved in capsule biosynthesis